LDVGVYNVGMVDDDSIDKAFREVKRSNFLPKSEKSLADLDTALYIGYGQTNSQPTTVRMMLEWLDAQPGDKVLDVGSGSGWSTALLANIVGPKGMVYAVERVPELVEFGRRNCQASGITNAKFYKAGDIIGLPEYAPFDRILVSADASELPDELMDQLKIGGKTVIPIHDIIYEVTKLSKTKNNIKKHPYFIFVPLI